MDRNFYVDDGLMSTPDSEQAIDLLGRTQAMLATANLYTKSFQTIPRFRKPFLVKIEQRASKTSICAKTPSLYNDLLAYAGT